MFELSAVEALTVLTALFWSLVAFDRKRWWPASHFLEPEPAAPGGGNPQADDLLVAIAARNEAALLPATLPSLLAEQRDYAHLVLVDDRSSDGTAAVAEKLAAEGGAAGRLTVIAGSPPPPGWSGKLHALAQALREAFSGPAGERIRWVLFTDADIEHPPGSIRALRAKAAGGYDLVSVMVRLRTESFWEKLLIPPFVHFFQLLYPFRRVADPRSRTAAAAGGCILIRRELLEAAGGLEAIHGAVIDDVALARRAKACGGRLWLGFCSSMRSLRGYETPAEVVRMVARTAFTQLRQSYALWALTLPALAALLVAPPFFCAFHLAAGAPLAAALAGLSWALESAMLLPAVLHHRTGAGFALALPVASLFYLLATALSGWNHLRRKGVVWRGRRMEVGARLPG